MSYVDIDTVIARAETVIPKSTTEDKAIWREWVWMSLQDLGISDEDIKSATLYPKNGLCKKPDDFRVLVDIVCVDSNNSQLVHKFRTKGHRLYYDTRTDLQTPSGVPVDVSEDRFNFILGTNADDVAAVNIRYFSYPIDKKTGMPMVREDEVMAIIYFIRYMWSMRKDDNRSEIQEKQVAWFRESDRVRARKKMNSLTEEKAKAIGKSWMRLIPDFNLQRY